MERSRVALVRCSSYDCQEVSEALSDALRLLGGADTLVGRTERLLLKPNVLADAHPDQAVSPHPEVFRAVARQVRDTTRTLTYGDSPGPAGGRRKHLLEACGIRAVAEELRLGLADFQNGRDIRFPASPFVKEFRIAAGVTEADGLVSICKLKTHQLTRITGAVKNQFGCIPGMAKGAFHLKMPDTVDFGKMLVSLSLLLRPRLYVMDAVVAMQGNGPRSGDPVHMGALLASTDPVALDAVAAMLVDLRPELVCTAAPGREWGLGTHLSEEIEVLGESPTRLANGDFVVDRRPQPRSLPLLPMSIAKTFFGPKPVIDAAKCVRCGACVEACPVTPKALAFRDPGRKRPPSYTYGRCIRCYCCQETCPERAISVRKPILPLA